METVTLSRELCDLLYRALNGGADQLTGMEHGRAFRELSAALADPVPPAGGEVEVLGYAVKDYPYSLRCSRAELDKLTIPFGEHQVIELVDRARAHVTRLQAEVERRDSKLETMRNKNNELNDTVAAMVNEVAVLRQEVETRIGAEVNAIEYLQQAQAELTKALELLNKAPEYLMRGPLGAEKLREEILANQSAKV